MPATLGLPLILNLSGLVLFLGLLLYSRRREYAPAPPCEVWWAPVGLLALGLLLTIPYRPPFAPGMRLGIGYVAGGAMALLASWAVGRLKLVAVEERFHVVGALMALPAFALSIVLLAAYAAPDAVLMGFALGTVVVVLTGPRATEMDWLGLVTVTLCAAQCLAVSHFPTAAVLERFAALIVAGMLGLAYAVPVHSQRQATPFGHLAVLSVLCAALIAVLMFLGRMNPAVTLVGELVVLGLMAGWVLAWLAHGLGTVRRVSVAVVGLLAILVLLVGYKLLAGYGVALMLLGLLLAVGWACAGRETEGDGIWVTLRGMAQLGVGVLVFRLFLEQYQAARGVDYEQQFVLIGLLLGLALPLFASTEVNVCCPRLRGVALVVAAALAPAVVFVVWDYKALVGLILGTVAWLFVAMYESDEKREAAAAGWFALLIGLVAAQFTAVLDPLTNLTRTNKAAVLLALAAVFLAWVVQQMIVMVRREGGPDDVA